MTTEHSGGGDVSRSMELLWGLGERPSRGPKPGLTLDRIVDAAVAVADAEGLDAASMRRVATELGVGTMSLYRYVPGRAELLDLMLDKVVDVGSDARPDPDGGWRATLETAARGTLRLHRQHPWLLHVDQGRPVLGPNTMQSIEYVLAGLAGTGLSDREKMHLLLIVDGFVTGTVRTQLNAEAAARRTGVSDEEFWKSQEPVLAEVMTSGRFPLMEALSMDAFEDSGDEVFELGLTALLDGLTPFVESRTPTNGSRTPASKSRTQEPGPAGA